MAPFRKFPKTRIQEKLEKSHAWPLERFSKTIKFFNGDHWIVPELKKLFAQTTKK